MQTPNNLSCNPCRNPRLSKLIPHLTPHLSPHLSPHSIPHAPNLSAAKLAIAAEAPSPMRRWTRVLRNFLSLVSPKPLAFGSVHTSHTSHTSLCWELPSGFAISQPEQIQCAEHRLNHRLILGAAGLVALVFLSSCAHCPKCGQCAQGQKTAAPAKASGKVSSMHHGHAHKHGSGYFAPGDGEGQPVSPAASRPKSAKERQSQAGQFNPTRFNKGG